MIRKRRSIRKKSDDVSDQLDSVESQVEISSSIERNFNQSANSISRRSKRSSRPSRAVTANLFEKWVKFCSLLLLVPARRSPSRWRHLEKGKKGWLKTTFSFGSHFYNPLKKFTLPFCFTTFTFASEEQEINVDVEKLIQKG